MKNDEFFEFDETQNDWMKLCQKINLFFLILIKKEFISDVKPFSKYLQN